MTTSSPKPVAISVVMDFMAASICSGPATPLHDSQGNVVRSCAGIATMFAGGTPMIILTLVENDRQTTMALDPDALDKFCDMLAKAVHWQNAALTPASGSTH